MIAAISFGVKERRTRVVEPGAFLRATAPASVPAPADRPGRESAAAIRTDVDQDIIHAFGAKGALAGADPRFCRFRRQVLVAIFAVRSEFEPHLQLPSLKQSWTAAPGKFGFPWRRRKSPSLAALIACKAFRACVNCLGFSWIPSSETSDFNVLRGNRPGEIFIWAPWAICAIAMCQIDAGSTGAAWPSRSSLNRHEKIVRRYSDFQQAIVRVTR